MKSSVWPENVRSTNGALTVQLPDEHGEVGDSNIVYKLVPVNEYDLDKKKVTYTRVGFAHFRVITIGIALLVFSLISFACGAVLIVYGASAVADYIAAFTGGIFFILAAALGITSGVKLKDCPIAGMMVLSVLGAMGGACMLGTASSVMMLELNSVLTAVNADISIAMHITEIICGLTGMILCVALSGMSFRAICCSDRHFTVTVIPGRKQPPKVHILPVPMGYSMSSYLPGSVEMSYTGRHSPEMIKVSKTDPVEESLQHRRNFDGESLPPAMIISDNAQQQANLKRWKINKGLMKTVNVLYGLKSVDNG